MRRAVAGVGVALLLVAPLLLVGGVGQYVLHVLIQVFIWSFVGQAWSLMGRFGLVSLGHGAFLGLGAYTVALLWNFFHLTPWIGAVVAVVGTGLFAAVVAYPCSRFRVVGHYFALVTLAVGEVIRLLIIAERDWTGGSLGLTLKTAGTNSLLAVQFADRRIFYYGTLALWAFGLWVWWRLDRSMARAAMEAIGEDETAAASVGIHVTRFKIAITVLSAALTAVGGVAYAQYIAYVNPETLAGIGVSLRIVFAVVLGGMYVLLGPTVGTALTIALSESLRIAFGIKFIGMAETIYGLLLVLFIIFLPAGIWGGLARALARPARPTAQERRVSARRRALRELVERRQGLVVPGAYDAVSARLVEQAGFPAVYMTGFGVSAARLGLPDLGFAGLAEMVDQARNLASAVSIPLIADADTGYGSALQVRRTVQQYEQAGVAALHLEDQVAPKRCGHLAGKQVVPAEEFVGRIRAAVEARTDPDLLIIARTDAIAVTGFDDAVERASAAARRGRGRPLRRGADLRAGDRGLAAPAGPAPPLQLRARAAGRPSCPSPACATWATPSSSCRSTSCSPRRGRCSGRSPSSATGTRRQGTRSASSRSRSSAS